MARTQQYRGRHRGRLSLPVADLFVWACAITVLVWVYLTFS